MAKYQPLAQCEEDMEADSMQLDDDDHQPSSVSSTLSFDHQAAVDLRKPCMARGKIKSKLLKQSSGQLASHPPPRKHLDWLPPPSSRSSRSHSASRFSTRYGLLQDNKRGEARSLDTIDTGYSGSEPVHWPSLNADQTSSSSDSDSTKKKLYQLTPEDGDFLEAHKAKEHKTTNLQTMMHLLKGNIGTGILAMPSAFANSGLMLGLGMLPFFCLLCTHCMHILTKANRVLPARLSSGLLDYQDVAEHALSHGPQALRKHARLGSRIITIFLLITQFGFCCVYSLFVAENLSKVLSEFTSNKFELVPHVFLLILLPLFMALVCVKSLAHLAIASSLANLFQSLGLLIVMWDLVHNLPLTSSRAWVGPWQRFPLFMGTAIYAFEGIGLILPLQKEMSNPAALGGKLGVLNTGMAVVACMNIAIGFFGYLKFGPAVQGSITLNLPAEPIYQSCKIMFALAIFLSYAIQFYVPFNIIWPWARSHWQLEEGTRREWVWQHLARAAMVTFTLSLAALVPRLDLFISLVGALSSSCLALIFPPLIDVCVRWEDDTGLGHWTWIFFKNACIFFIGLLAFTTGTYASILDIVSSFRV